jgi:hypothetical protein
MVNREAVEAAIIAGAQNAQTSYKLMSGYYWLQHAPEYFLTTHVALSIYNRTLLNVYMDTPLKRIMQNDWGDKRGLRLSKNNIRPDVSVWSAASKSLFACIEAKINPSKEQFLEDVNRMHGIIGRKFGCERAYSVVFFSDAKKHETYKSRIKDWEGVSGWSCNDQQIFSPKGDDAGWQWSIALFRHPKSVI